MKLQGISKEGMQRIAQMEEGYQGWANYETWAVALWINNDQVSYQYWWEVVEELREAGHPRDDSSPSSVTDDDYLRFDLADQLKDYHEDVMPELDGVWGDLLNGALSEVRWDEIAANILAE